MLPDCRKTGFSMIELLVAVTITIALSAGIFSVMSSARSTAALGRAKDEAKQMAEIALKMLQKDIAISHATIDKDNIVDGKPKVTLTFKAGSASSWSMKIPKVENADSMIDDYVDVEYTLSDKKLVRSGGVEGKSKVVARNISKLDIFVLSAEQVSVEIEAEVTPPGQTQSVKHNQKMLVTIREAVAVNVDERWRTSDEVISSY